MNVIRTLQAALGYQVYTQVYTGVETSDHLGPRAVELPRPKTVSIARICPASSKQDLLSPQRRELIANETLYQLSYTPNLIDFNELYSNPRNTKRCLSIQTPNEAGTRHR